MTHTVKDDSDKKQATAQPKCRNEAGSRPPMLVGYARVSTEEQNLALQQDALYRAACVLTFEDQGVSGVQPSRPGLEAALRVLTRGDTLVVWRLDRLGRSLVQLASLIDNLTLRGIGVRSLTESFDAASAGGRLVIHLMAAMAEFERSLIAERTRAGLAAARARGRRLGRPPILTDEQRKAVVISVRDGCSVREVAQAHGVHPRTVYRLLRASEDRIF